MISNDEIRVKKPIDADPVFGIACKVIDCDNNTVFYYFGSSNPNNYSLQTELDNDKELIEMVRSKIRKCICEKPNAHFCFCINENFFDLRSMTVINVFKL